MASFPTYNPEGKEAISPPIGGLSQAISRIGEIIELKTTTFTDIPMHEVFATGEEDENRYRLYAVSMEYKNWINDGTLIVKKNGEVITPELNAFEIDYLGGSIEFMNQNNKPLSTDVLTVSGTHIIGESDMTAGINDNLIYNGSLQYNDKGLTAYTEDGETLNNWYKTGGKVTVNDNYVTFSNEGAEASLESRIPLNILKKFQGKDVTLSLKIKDDEAVKEVTFKLPNAIDVNTIFQSDEVEVLSGYKIRLIKNNGDEYAVGRVY